MRMFWRARNTPVKIEDYGITDVTFSIFVAHISESGGIGRRARLRIW